MLAPFLGREELSAIIGADLFADAGQIAGFADLMSDEDKPFECVGERRESAAALRLLSSRPGWRDTAVVAALADRARTLVDEADVRDLLTPSGGSVTDSRLGTDVTARVRHLMEHGR
jgi:hypothetical protein